MLDLGWQTRHEGLDSERRKHGLFLLCIPSLFSLGGAHCTALYTFLSILINELVHELAFLLFCARILIILRTT